MEDEGKGGATGRLPPDLASAVTLLSQPSHFTYAALCFPCLLSFFPLLMVRACNICHRTFDTQRAFNTHNNTLHRFPKPPLRDSNFLYHPYLTGVSPFYLDIYLGRNHDTLIYKPGRAIRRATFSFPMLLLPPKKMNKIGGRTAIDRISRLQTGATSLLLHPEQILTSF